MAVNSPVGASAGVFVGEDRTLRWTIRDSTGAVADITGRTYEWRLEPTQGGTAVVTKSGVVTDGPNGVVTVTLAAADTTGLAGGNYWHALSRTDSGNNRVQSSGTFLLQAR